MNTLVKQPKQNISTPFFVALTLMAMSLPLSLFMMSLMQFILLGYWAYEGYHDYYNTDSPISGNKWMPKWIAFPIHNIRIKMNGLRTNKMALVIFSFYLLHLCGLVFTEDFTRAIEILRITLPMLVLTLVFASSRPLNKNQFNSLLLFYIVAIISGTFLGFYKFIGQNFSDVRELSIFIHPIKFGLNICFSIFLLIYFIYKNEFESIFARILFFIGIIWLLYFLVLIESGMGLSTLFIVCFGLVIYYIFKHKSKFTYFYLALVLLIPFFIFLNINKLITEFYAKPDLNFNALDSTTKLGAAYTHDTLNYGVEEGKYVGLYICETELKKAWETRSNIAYEEHDKNDQELKRTLIRFLTSCDLRKDYSGVKQLSDKDIHAIERGIANIRYLEKPGIKSRIYKFLIGYNNYIKHNDPNGNSTLQRFEYWKASVQIIKKNFWTGVGTGDITPEFLNYYEVSNSPLKPENRRLTHNQYLNIMVNFGLFGLIWFLFILIYPLSFKSIRKDFYFSIFISVMLISMLSNDTLTSSAGVNFYAFFTALLLFGRRSQEQL